MGDVNIEMDGENSFRISKSFQNFSNIFGLENLIEGSTCVTVGPEPKSIDVFLTNKNVVSKTVALLQQE